MFLAKTRRENNGKANRHKVFEAECSPFQHALSTRAAKDCVGHMLRAATDARPTATLTGSGRVTTCTGIPGARAILPFVRLSYAQPSNYAWYENKGERRIVTQAEGGEQEDPPNATRVCLRHPRRAGRSCNTSGRWRAAVCVSR